MCKSKPFVKCFFLISFLISTAFSQLFAQKDYGAIEKQLNTLIDTVYSNNKVPGIAVQIFLPDFTYQKVVGKADLNTGRERSLDDKIRIGSITKTFVATVILQLVDEGKIALDDPLSKYMPDYPNGSNITIRQILDMTSGIHDYLDDPLVGESFFYFRTNKFTPKELYEATMGLNPYFAPGKGWTYSNGNYNILGMLVEQLTGNKLEDELNKRIITPLGLTNTTLPVSAKIDGQHSNGYMLDTSTNQLVDVTEIEPSITWAAGAMVSDFKDLKTYVKALVTGAMLSPNTQAERLKFVPTGLKTWAGYGLGIFRLEGFIGHNGGITGYNTMMVYDPELDATFLMSVNQFGPGGGLVDNLFMEAAKIVYPEKNLFR